MKCIIKNTPLLIDARYLNENEALFLTLQVPVVYTARLPENAINQASYTYGKNGILKQETKKRLADAIKDSPYEPYFKMIYFFIRAQFAVMGRSANPVIPFHDMVIDTDTPPQDIDPSECDVTNYYSRTALHDRKDFLLPDYEFDNLTQLKIMCINNRYFATDARNLRDFLHEGAIAGHEFDHTSAWPNEQAIAMHAQIMKLTGAARVPIFLKPNAFIGYDIQDMDDNDNRVIHQLNWEDAGLQVGPFKKTDPKDKAFMSPYTRFSQPRHIINSRILYCNILSATGKREKRPPMCKALTDDLIMCGVQLATAPREGEWPTFSPRGNAYIVLAKVKFLSGYFFVNADTLKDVRTLEAEVKTGYLIVDSKRLAQTFAKELKNSNAASVTKSIVKKLTSQFMAHAPVFAKPFGFGLNDENANQYKTLIADNRNCLQISEPTKPYEYRHELDMEAIIHKARDTLIKNAIECNPINFDFNFDDDEPEKQSDMREVAEQLLSESLMPMTMTTHRDATEDEMYENLQKLINTILVSSLI